MLSYEVSQIGLLLYYGLLSLVKSDKNTYIHIYREQYNFFTTPSASQ